MSALLETYKVILGNLNYLLLRGPINYIDLSLKIVYRLGLVNLSRSIGVIYIK